MAFPIRIKININLDNDVTVSPTSSEIQSALGIKEIIISCDRKLSKKIRIVGDDDELSPSLSSILTEFEQLNENYKGIFVCSTYLVRVQANLDLSVYDLTVKQEDQLIGDFVKVILSKIQMTNERISEWKEALKKVGIVLTEPDATIVSNLSMFSSDQGTHKEMSGKAEETPDTLFGFLLEH